MENQDHSELHDIEIPINRAINHNFSLSSLLLLQGMFTKNKKIFLQILILHFTLNFNAFFLNLKSYKQFTTQRYTIVKTKRKYVQQMVNRYHLEIIEKVKNAVKHWY